MHRYTTVIIDDNFIFDGRYVPLDPRVRLDTGDIIVFVRPSLRSVLVAQAIRPSLSDGSVEYEVCDCLDH